MTTIRLGSAGPDVSSWQKVLGIAQTGTFDQATDTATRAYQQKHKLVVDGVVGPATWASSSPTGSIPKVTKTAQAPMDITAYDVAKQNTSLTEKQRQYVLAVARGEGFFGNGWGSISPIASQFGLTGQEGLGSNNWGAVQGQGNAGSFPHIDYHANGQPYVGTFKRYAQPIDGFNDMANVILGGGTKGAAGAAKIKSAIDKGNLHDAVYTQHENGYFELDPAKYLQAVLNNFGILTANTDWKPLLGPKGVNALGEIILGIGIGVVGAGAMWLLRKAI